MLFRSNGIAKEGTFERNCVQHGMHLQDVDVRVSEDGGPGTAQGPVGGGRPQPAREASV